MNREAERRHFNTVDDFKEMAKFRLRDRGIDTTGVDKGDLCEE